MSYGFVAYDALGKKIIDSEAPALALEKIVTLTGVATYYGFTTIQRYYPWDPNDPLRYAYLNEQTTLPFGATIGSYNYDLSTLLNNDPTASSAVLAFSIPVGGFAFYYSAERKVLARNTMPTMQVAVLKPVSVLGLGAGGYGAAVYNASGQLTWSPLWPLVRIQGPIGNKTIQQSSWFALSGNRVRRVDSQYANPPQRRGYSGLVGVLRTGATTIETKYHPAPSQSGGVTIDLLSNWDNYGADSGDSKGFVLYNISV